jgi:hypothetical protein
MQAVANPSTHYRHYYSNGERQQTSTNGLSQATDAAALTVGASIWLRGREAAPV